MNERQQEVESVTGQMTLEELDLTKLAAPEALMAAAVAWIAENPSAWDFIVGAAQRDALETGRVRIKAYVEYLRFTPIGQSTKQVKLANALSAPFGRILAAWEPQLAQYIPLNHSKLDGVVIPPKPAGIA
jgi:hypothetical protein